MPTNSKATQNFRDYVEMFASMRPSERTILQKLYTHDPDTFFASLDAWLKVWSQNDWVEEYKIQRTGKWMAKLFGADNAKKIARHVDALVPANAAPASIADKAFRAFKAGIERDTVHA